MPGTIGRRAKVAVSTDDVNYLDVGLVKSANLSSATDVADDTTNDSNGFKEGLYADAQSTLAVTARYDDTEPGLIAIMDEYFTLKSKLYIRYRPTGDVSGDKQWIFLATIDDFNMSTSTGESEECDFTATSTGAINMSNQP
jgi:hypothetical protein